MERGSGMMSGGCGGERLMKNKGDGGVCGG